MCWRKVVDEPYCRQKKAAWAGNTAKGQDVITIERPKLLCLIKLTLRLARVDQLKVKKLQIGRVQLVWRVLILDADRHLNEWFGQ